MIYFPTDPTTPLRVIANTNVWEEAILGGPVGGSRIDLDDPDFGL